MRRLGIVLGLGLTAVALWATSSAALPADADLSLRLTLGRGGAEIPDKTTGSNFQIVITVDSAAAVEQTAITVGLPEGLRWGNDAPDPTEGCTGTAPAVCRQRLSTNPVGTFGGGCFWDVVADRPGTYDVTASVTGEQPDPDAVNNTATLRFEVVASSGGGAGGGGGGNGGGGSGGRRLVGRREGKRSEAVTSEAQGRLDRRRFRSCHEGRLGLRPRGVACAASVGRVKVKGPPKAASGVASCLFKTPKSAKGKQLAGSIAFTAGGSSFTKRFAARLG
jgi:hypothetical protein